MDEDYPLKKDCLNLTSLDDNYSTYSKYIINEVYVKNLFEDLIFGIFNNKFLDEGHFEKPEYLKNYVSIKYDVLGSKKTIFEIIPQSGKLILSLRLSDEILESYGSKFDTYPLSGAYGNGNARLSIINNNDLEFAFESIKWSLSNVLGQEIKVSTKKVESQNDLKLNESHNSENKNFVEYEGFYDYLLNNGYYFDKEMIENYLLSLKVKPFAILTGNSGTGKTKLSQLFAKYISDFKESESSTKNDSQISDDGYVTIKVKTNMSSWKNVGWTLSKKEFEGILPIKESEGNFKLEIGGIKGECYINILPQLYYDKENTELITYFKELYEEDENQLVDMKINCDALKEFISKDYIETNGEITLQQNSNKSAIEARQWFISKKIFNYLPFDSGFTDVKIIVNGISANAKIRMVPKLTYSPNEELSNYLNEHLNETVNVKITGINLNFDDFKAKWKCEKKVVENLNKYFNNVANVINYKIVPVGANWTENRNIVGYYNLITEEYQSTPAYDLINQSKENLEAPHFLILDEMNLSHVERYFADFLSAIESGENIPLYGIDDDLEIPENLFIIGTVNVDETTYMFSPKVLDRANVLEFETYSSKDYMKGNINLNAPEGNIGYLENPLIDSDIRNLGINELKESFNGVKVQNTDFWDLLSDEIFKFQTILKESGFDFGFRVINEIVRFMLVAWRYEGEPVEWTNWERYFDAQIKQKLLPKLHGSEKILGDTLQDLAKACEDEEGIKYYTSAKKLNEMIKVLDKQRYVSFIN